MTLQTSIREGLRPGIIDFKLSQNAQVICEGEINTLEWENTSEQAIVEAFSIMIKEVMLNWLDE